MYALFKHTQAQLQQAKQRRRQQGFLSLEAGLVLLLVALAIVAAVIYYRDNLRKSSVNTNVSQILSIAGAARSTFGQSNRYGDVDTGVAVTANIIPASLRDGTNQTATNTFGGAIAVAPVNLTGTNDGLQITWPNVPSNQCIDIVMGVDGEARVITVAGTEVKPNNGTLNVGTTSTQCESATTVPLVVTIGRN